MDCPQRTTQRSLRFTIVILLKKLVTLLQWMPTQFKEQYRLDDITENTAVFITNLLDEPVADSLEAESTILVQLLLVHDPVSVGHVILIHGPVELELGQVRKPQDWPGASTPGRWRARLRKKKTSECNCSSTSPRLLLHLQLGQVGREVPEPVPLYQRPLPAHDRGERVVWNQFECNQQLL